MAISEFDPVLACFCGVQFLPIPRLERLVIEKLTRYERTSGLKAELPIDIEYMIEIMEGIKVDYFDDSAGFAPDVLGAYDFTGDKMFVRQAIEHEGRRRFTLAHEYGHYVLHKPHFLQQVLDLFDGESHKVVQLNREAGDSRNKLEWQANAFAGQILMPTKLVEAQFSSSRERMNTGQLVQELAANANVSLASAEIRLKQMGWIDSRS